jgi:ATP/maltotriose-dependent transcriptional regulator MalT
MSAENARGRTSIVPARTALQVALDAIDGPALIVDRGGEVVRANAAAQALLDNRGVELRVSLTRTVAGDVTESLWILTPLHDGERSLGFLARPAATTWSARQAHIGNDVNEPDEVKEARLDEVVRRASRLWHLTQRQSQVLELVARGLGNTTVAESLEVGNRTIEYHLSAIFDKAGVDSRAMLLARLLDV